MLRADIHSTQCEGYFAKLEAYFAMLEVNDSWLKMIRLTKKIPIKPYKSSIFIIALKRDFKVFVVSIIIAT